MQRRAQRCLSYQNRQDFTRQEILAINHYKDLVNPQYNWNYQPSIGSLENIGIDCYMVNNILRGHIPLSELTKRDIVRFNNIVLPLSSAIQKSVVVEDVHVLKGLYDSSWIEVLNVMDVFSDDGFGSFTTSEEIAMTYARKNKEGKRVFISLDIHAGDCALFVDNDEMEYILPKGMQYVIAYIDDFHDARIYHVEKEI